MAQMTGDDPSTVEDEAVRLYHMLVDEARPSKSISKRIGEI
jgi:hypothetical protein